MTPKNILLQVLLVPLAGLYGQVYGENLYITLTPNNRTRSLTYSGSSEDAAPPSTYVAWLVTGPPGSRLVLHCPLILFETKDCAKSFLSASDRGGKVKVCPLGIFYTWESVGNEMMVEFKTGPHDFGWIDCVVRFEQEVTVPSVVSGLSGPVSGTLGSSKPVSELGFSKPNTGTKGSSKHIWRPDFKATSRTRPASGVTDTGDYAGVIPQGDKNTSCDCGWTNRRRIIGGEETEPNEYVFMAYIRLNWAVRGFCGGSILTQRHILTAAHCLTDQRPSGLEVVVGGHNVTADIQSETAQVRNVSELYSHEMYSNTSMMNDIGLVLLSADILFTHSVGPVCLPTELYPLVGQYVTALGWGRLSKDGRHSYTLRSVNLKVNQTASPIVPGMRQYTQIFMQEGTGKGDSGGPVLYLDPELGRYVQVGIISFSFTGDEKLSAHTDVFSYFEWIKKIIGKYSPQLYPCHKN